jgi:Ring finger domain
MGQSRARGITRAILETFPIVKFGGASEDRSGATPRTAPKDLEENSDRGSSDGPIEMTEWQVVSQPSPKTQDQPVAEADGRPSGEIHEEGDEIQEQAHASTSQTPVESPSSPSRRRSSQNAKSSSANEEVVPAAIGYATCPICIVDFEEGDDLRVLPCEGKHRFHQTCVDPWLLELSSSCPICRQGASR